MNTFHDLSRTRVRGFISLGLILLLVIGLGGEVALEGRY